jgi:4-amino-4-deoxy-L-arabinose transferase-like glycosyltransferase
MHPTTGVRDRLLAAYGRGTGVTALTPRERRWLAAIVLVAFALRVWWVIYATRPAQGLHDPLFYSVYGRSIAEGDGYRLASGPGAGEPTAYYPVGYPAALGAVFWVMYRLPFGNNEPMAAALFNVVLAVATVWLAFEVARRLFDNRIGLVAAAIIALYPNLIFHTAVVLTETLFNFVVMGALLLLFWRPWTEALGRTRLLVFGALVGFSALVRPISVTFLPGLFVVWIVTGFGWRRAIHHVALIAAGTALVIAPWTVRNAIVMNSPVLISTNFGDNLCIGRHPGASGAFDFDLSATGAQGVDYCFHDLGDETRPAYEIRRNDLTTDRALDYLREHPVDELRLLFWRAYYTFESDTDGLDAAESYREDRFIRPRNREVLETLANFWYWSTSALGILGVIFVASRRKPRRLFFGVAMLLLAVTPLIFFGDPRFHVPVVPLIAITAAAALVTIRANLARVAGDDAV